MSNVEDIEKAIENLPPAELAQFRAWFEAFDAEVFDQKIAADASSGKLDGLAEQALNGYSQGRARDL
ncbi:MULTISPECIES: hypothetical protein [unclassified Tardiphaga]|jgi:hypothetical protein|uniref:hypothetical protein n=1 Tax=unclassified Tardiphaga TaxID=2631404 RepID=UPI0008A79FDB|nr:MULTISPECIES: hypothetical protein [unclassified Tardiphaga]SEI16329.1 hypothetical protein SAMN05216367_4351 [Tardiphaga sp. OK245]SNS37445.1 hypothetical protein SAMN05216374_1033 [Tardiphaga sp. OK246]